MNPESPQTPRDQMEQRLTALLLGELSAEEAASVHRAMEQDGELAKLFARLHHTVGLVRETVSSPSEPASVQAAPTKLSAARREKLLAHFKTVTPEKFTPEKRRGRFTLVELAAALVILGVLAAMIFPTASSMKRKSSLAHQVDVLQDSRSDLVQQSVREPDQNSLPALFDNGGVSFGTKQTPPAEPVMTVALGGVGGARESLGYGLNRGEPSTTDFSAAGFSAEETAKRPTAITPPPGKPSAPIVLPPPAGNYSYFDGGAAAGGSDALTLGGKAELGQRFYRIASDSGAGGGGGGAGALQVTATDSLGEHGRAAESLLRKDIPVRYTSPGSVAVALESFTDDRSDNRSVTRGDSVNPATGFEIASAGGLVEGSGQQLETRTFNVKPEVFNQALESIGGLARNGLGEQTPQTHFSIPRVGVTGDSSGGAGGGGQGGSSFSLVTNSLAEVDRVANNFYSDLGVKLDAKAGESVSYDDRTGKLTVRATRDGSDQVEQINDVLAMKPPEVNVKARFAETTQNDGSVLGADWYAGSKLNTGKDALADQANTTLSVANQPPQDLLNRGAVTTLSGRAGGLNSANGTTLLGDLPTLGRLFKDSDRNNVVPASPVPDGGRIAPEPQVYSLDVVGYANVASQPVDSAGVNINGTARRRSDSIALPKAMASVAPRQPQGSQSKNKSAIDSPSVTGKRSREVMLAKAANADRQLGEEQAVSEKSRPFEEKKRELQELMDYRRLLTRKMNIEKTDLSLPRSSQVEIVEQAIADSTPPSWFGKVRGAFGGEVERTATASIKAERDKADIDEISGKSMRYNPYDPYFVSTESETIQSETVLGKVVDQLKLDEAWANGKGNGAKLKKNEAVALLRKRLEVSRRPNTTVVDIHAKSAKPEEAAQIANAVVAAYQAWRRERGTRMVYAGVAELEKQSALQDKKIEQAKMELDRLRRELKISDADAGRSSEADVAPVRKPSTNAPIPQPEIQTRENNFSTFSLNVSDVSFKLAAASLEKGQLPDAASIRSEEFINAFDYRDPEPAAGAPIAFAYERARYPFAHNRDLLRFSLKTAAAGRQAGRPLNIVVLLDNSGSMERADRVQIIREALRVLAGQLQPQDKLSVITFARTARLVADGVSGDKAGEVAEQVSGITPQGGTNLEDAMNLAYQTAVRHYLANGINRVVLLTDGAANLGDVEPESLKQKVEAQRKQGIALDCFGIGWEGVNDDLLEVLSRNGDGRYGFINSPEEAATDFVGQLAGALKVAASDVKVQVEFNPKRVTTYRQIGYTKHQLTQEQFRDNTVDAAEIAAQEAGNALYTVEVKGGGFGPLCTVRVRYKVPGTTDYREQAWDVPYTGNALALEQSSPAMRLAASASAFAEWLVSSPFAGEVTPDRLLGYLSGVPEIYGADARPKKLEWMIRQAKSLEGK